MFALVQTGVVTHAVSHINEHTQQSELTTHSKDNQDSNGLAEHCGQCIAYAQVDGALPEHTLSMLADDASFALSNVYQAYLASALTPSFSARAPPFDLNLLA